MPDRWYTARRYTMRLLQLIAGYCILRVIFALELGGPLERWEAVALLGSVGGQLLIIISDWRP